MTIRSATPSRHFNIYRPRHRRCIHLRTFITNRTGDICAAIIAGGCWFFLFYKLFVG